MPSPGLAAATPAILYGRPEPSGLRSPPDDERGRNVVPITEVDKIWMNGAFVDWADAKIHVLSHGLHYGSGVFEGIRAYATTRGPAVWVAFRKRSLVADGVVIRRTSSPPVPFWP